MLFLIYCDSKDRTNLYLFNCVVDMLSPADMIKATRGQLKKLEKAYGDLKVEHVHLNAEYTAVLLWAYEMKDLLCAVGKVPPACPAPHDMHDTEPLGVGNGYLVCSGV